MRLNEMGHEKLVHQSVALAEGASNGQAELLGYAPMEPVSLHGYLNPSDALVALALRRGVVLGEGELQSLLGFDRLEQALRLNLARFVDAFLALDTAAYVDPGLLERLAGGDLPVAGAPNAGPGRSFPMEDLVSVGIDFSRLFPTRNQFLEAMLQLRDAMPQPLGAESCKPVHVPLVFSIDLGTCDNTYVYSYVLQLDFGGNDYYDNSAGGSNIYGGYNCGLLPGIRAALVDFGDGDDQYGNPALPRSCGVNGAGHIGGMGFLFDEGGDDRYLAFIRGTNGGAVLAGSGFLFDVDGRDTYTTVSGSGNGGGDDSGIGMLIDTGGDDVYSAGGSGVNGGGTSSAGRLRGVGFLLDTGGDDKYFSTAHGTNGGGYNGGRGVLIDLNGSDYYSSDRLATNGGGSNSGVGMGFLLDGAGDDRYAATWGGTNGGGYAGGFGMLVDLQGNDSYVATYWGTNGGGLGLQSGATPAIPFGVGLLLDKGGTDIYVDTLVSCQDCSVVPKGNVGAQLDSDQLAG